jgi:predicted dinucleotide-binding enzyme
MPKSTVFLICDLLTLMRVKYMICQPMTGATRAVSLTWKELQIMALARLFLAAGFRVAVASSGYSKLDQLSVEILAPGAKAVSSADAIAPARIVVLALPLSRFHQIDSKMMEGKIVVDAMNYWRPVDGLLSDFSEPDVTSSEVVQRALPRSPVVKTLNQIGYHALEYVAGLSGGKPRRALGLAGDTEPALSEVERVVDRLGFDPVRVGSLRESALISPDGEAFGRSRDRTELSRLADHLDARHANP